MFTGIIESLGQIISIKPGARDKRFGIRAEKLTGFVLGESIAVNGVCLTVESFEKNVFSVYASPETLSLTNLDRLRIGSKVNLERALTLQTRLGGHLVSGHVDCLAKVEEIKPKSESLKITLSFADKFSLFVIPKGSVALDGISLTVNECGQGFLTVNIIPATAKETTIQEWQKGRLVNLETDLLGKYVYNFFKQMDWGSKLKEQKQGSKLSVEFLRQHGF